MRHSVIKIAEMFALVFVTCAIPLLFSSGCMFDPSTTTSTSDSATFKVNGRVLGESSSLLKGIQVALRDSLTGSQSSWTTTDTTGMFTLSFSYIKKQQLLVVFFDPTKTYLEKHDTINFDDNTIKYNLTKYHETTLTKK